MLKKRAFHIITFGCQMNTNDSDWISRALSCRDFTPASLEDAELVILNTCSVRDKPEHKVYSELGRLNLLNKERGGKLIVAVGGCVAQQIGKKLMSRFPLVRLVFGPDNIARTPEALEQICENSRLRLCLTDFEENFTERPNCLEALAPGEKIGSAFVNIMQGCDNFCAYCIVPLVRGRQKSRASEAVLDECRELAARGCREITLLGQNVNSYGQDKTGDGTSFTQLLLEAAKIEGLERLRFMTAHPKDLSPELIRAFGETEKICPRLHLPLQSGSDRILERMGRRYNLSAYMKLVEELRKVSPNIQLSTDIIVGFPSESEEDFASTLRTMDEIGFINSFSFIYSDRPGARAALFDGKIERAVALERLQELQERQKECTDKILSAMVQTNTQVLVDEKISHSAESITLSGPLSGTNIEQWHGRDTFGNAVKVTMQANNSCPSYKGLLVPVTITEARQNSLVAVQAGEAW